MKEALISLLQITNQLQAKYNRRFTLDGKLIGDIGEALAQENFYIELLPENTKKIDAVEISTGRQIQIKSTMKGYFTYPFEYDPDFLLAIKILPTGQIETIFNGPGSIVREYILKKNLRSFRNSYYSLSLC